MLGSLLCALSFVILVFADSFADFIVYEIVMALGISMNSGADLALLYDSQTRLNEHSNSDFHGDNNRHIARLITIEGVGGGVAAVAAAVLSLWSLDWVLWAQSAIGLAALLFSLRLIEAPRQINRASSSERNHGDNWKHIAKALFARPLVFWIAITTIVSVFLVCLTFGCIKNTGSYNKFRYIGLVTCGLACALFAVYRLTMPIKLNNGWGQKSYLWY